MILNFKMLKPNTCAVNIGLNLGDGDVVFGASATSSVEETPLLFSIRVNATYLMYVNETGDLHTLGEAVDTTGMMQPGSFSRLRVSWCGGAMAIGPQGRPPMVTGQVNVSQPLPFVTARAEHAVSWLTVEADVADPWLFDGADLEPDPVFALTSPAMISRSIAPTSSVSVTYDCQSERACGVWFCPSPIETLFVAVGRVSKKISLRYCKVDTMKQIFHKKVTDLVLSNSTYTTVTVQYNNGTVTVYKGDATTPIYNASLPFSLPAITSIGIGNYGVQGSRMLVRAARYDPGWRLDTWRSQGVGFSNMALQQVPLP